MIEFLMLVYLTPDNSLIWKDANWRYPSEVDCLASAKLLEDELGPGIRATCKAVRAESKSR